jgi:hypothetical protein
MILVGAFALSMTFVTLALLLNSAVYTENLASRSNDIGASEAIEFRDEARSAASDTIQYINTNVVNNRKSAFVNHMEEWSDQVARYSSIQGNIMGVSVEKSDITTDGSGVITSAVITVVYQNSQTYYVADIRVEAP